MSTFLNQKEQVLEFKLTSVGRQLLGEGKFSPTFYQFYDQDITYNGAYGGIDEEQNDIVSRIAQTQRLGVQTDFTSSLSQQARASLDKHHYDRVTISNAKFFRPLGESDPWSDYAPSWKINCIDDSRNFVGDVQYKGELSIPSLSSSLDIRYETSEVPDGSTLSVLTKNDRVMIDIEEMNTVFKGDGNFDIEVYRVSKDENEENNVIPLFYIESMSATGDMLEQQRNPYRFLRPLTGSEQSLSGSFPRLNPDYVEYYLDIKVDQEIFEIEQKGTALLYAGNNQAPEEVCDQVSSNARFGVD